MSAPSLLEVEDLVVTFGRRRLFGRAASLVRAVDGVSLAVGRGEAVALVGESGSGKSTILRAVTGLHRSRSGSVRLDGIELTGLSERGMKPHRRRMPMVFQDPQGSLDPRLTVAAIVREPLDLASPRPSRAAREARVSELLEEVGLPAAFARRWPHELSGGQRQRVAIARALASRPELLLLDEPVSALDVSVRAQVLNLLADLRERHGLAWLMVSHDLAVVRGISERIVVLRRGRVVESGATDDVLSRPQHPYTRLLVDAVPVPDPTLRRRSRAPAI